MKRWFAQLSKSDIFKLVFCVLAAVYVIITVILYNTYRTYEYKGHRLRVVTVNDTEVVMKDENGYKLVLTANTVEKAIPFEHDYTINYRDETIRHIESFEIDGSVFTYSDGSQVTERGYVRMFSGNEEILNVRLTETQLAERELFYKLNDYYMEYKELGVYILVDFFGLALLFCGIGAFLYPEKLWRFNHFLDVIGGEPTDFAIITNKLSGIGLTILSYSIIFVFL